jgi:hypothetical protein
MHLGGRGEQVADVQKSPSSKGNFHESYNPGAGDVKPPSPRSTGIVFTVVALLVAVLLRRHEVYAFIAVGVAAVLLILSFTVPAVLQPLNILWFKFGLLLHRIVNPVVMLLMFAVAFLPMGVLVRIFADPLRLKRPKDVTTYWLEPDPAEMKLRSMKNQF